MCVCPYCDGQMVINFENQRRTSVCSQCGFELSAPFKVDSHEWVGD